MRLVDFEVPDKIQLVMVWLAVIQMILCTITLVCFARSMWTGAAMAGTSMRTPSRTRTGGTMATMCSLETVGFLLGLWPGSFCL